MRKVAVLHYRLFCVYVYRLTHIDPDRELMVVNILVNYYYYIICFILLETHSVYFSTFANPSEALALELSAYVLVLDS